MPQPQSPGRPGREQEVARLVLCLAVGLLGALPLAADAVARWLGWRIFFLSDGKLQLAWASVVLIVAGGPVVAALVRRPGPLQGGLLLGGLALFGYSAYLALLGSPGESLSFDWAAGLILLALMLRIRTATR